MTRKNWQNKSTKKIKMNTSDRPSKKKSHIWILNEGRVWLNIKNYGCTFMFKAFPAFVWINSTWLLGKEGKRPILWAGRACLTALIIPAAPASWLGLDNRLEEGLWAKTMKGERRKVEHSNKQEQPEALDQSRNTEKYRVRKPLDGGSENKPIEQSRQGGWNKRNQRQ